MLLKISAYIKSYDGETKWIYFLLNMINYQKNIMVSGIKLVIVLRKNLIVANRQKMFLKTEIRIYGHDAADFYDNEIPKVDYVCLAAILIDFILKKR